MYEPVPIETDHIPIDEHLALLIEDLARNTHDVWARQRMMEGWTFGPTRDDALKQTPCLVPYDQLPESEKDYDRRIVAETIKAIVALGYRIDKEV